MWSIKKAPDGGLNILVEDETVTQVAQRLMCWSSHDKRISYVLGAPFQYFHIPAEVCKEGYGDLVLEDGGTPVPCNTNTSEAFLAPALDDVSGIDPNNCSTTVPAPTGLVVTDGPTDHGFTVSWTYEGPPEVDGFRVVYREKSAENDHWPNRWQFLLPFTLPAYSRRATLGGLVPGTAYEVAVLAVARENWVGVQSPLSTPLVVTTTGTAPEPPVADLCASSGGGEDTITLTATPNGLSVSLTVDNKGEGEVSVDWGDGSSAETNPGDGTTELTHEYAEAGTYTITATDTDDAARTGTTEVTVAPAGGEEMALTATPNGLSVSLTVDNKGEGEVSVDWGDGSSAETNPGDGTTELTHEYAEAGTFTVTATDSDDSSRTGTTEVTVAAPQAASRRSAARSRSQGS